MAAKPQLSFQLYSSRNFPPVDDQLLMLASIGYRNVEPYGGLYADPERLRASLDRAGLKAPSGHFGLDELERDFSRFIAVARILGLNLIVAPWIPPAERPKHKEGWTALAKRLGVIARKVKTEGLGFAWHNHDFEFHPLPDGSLPIEHLLTNPDIELEFDLAWSVRAKADPAQMLRKLSGRIAACHVKDIAPAGQKRNEDGWADVGEGTIDWKSLWPLAVESGAKLMIAEHDNPKDFERFARASLKAMRRYESSTP